MQPQKFRDELIAVGSAIKGASAGAMVGFAFHLEHLIPADLALGEEFPRMCLLLVGQPAGMGPPVPEP